MSIMRQRISVSVTLEVDPEEWDREYGNGSSAKEVREDVKGYVKNLLQQSNDSLTVVSFK
jgi:hypothetical protein